MRLVCLHIRLIAYIIWVLLRLCHLLVGLIQILKVFRTLLIRGGCEILQIKLLTWSLLLLLLLLCLLSALSAISSRIVGIGLLKIRFKLHIHLWISSLAILLVYERIRKTARRYLLVEAHVIGLVL